MIISIVLLLLTLTWGIYQMRVNSSIQNSLNEQKLLSETNLSAKLALEKELDKIKTQMNALELEREDLDNKFRGAEKKFNDGQLEVARARKESQDNRKKYAQLGEQKRKVERELEMLKNSLQQLQYENNELKNNVAALQKNNQTLKDELQLAQRAHYDQPLIEAVRGKADKLMVKAKRTQKLKVNVLVPEELKEVQFKITGPGGVLSQNEDGTIATRVVNTNATAFSSSTTSNASLPKYKQMEMIFTSKKKLQPGVYHVAVMSENLAVGDIQIKLR